MGAAIFPRIESPKGWHVFDVGSTAEDTEDG
ncbi:hypothetical protein RLEG12_19265 [Rhizobium leguminosarum bv. trifolii CB782]|nr:hypothetical protein RLEG12_19265 [Rhizobium leguminosarum bv. trifolii CB782]